MVRWFVLILKLRCHFKGIRNGNRMPASGRDRVKKRITWMDVIFSSPLFGICYCFRRLLLLLLDKTPATHGEKNRYYLSSRDSNVIMCGVNWIHWNSSDTRPGHVAREENIPTYERPNKHQPQRMDILIYKYKMRGKGKERVEWSGSEEEEEEVVVLYDDPSKYLTGYVMVVAFRWSSSRCFFHLQARQAGRPGPATQVRLDGSAADDGGGRRNLEEERHHTCS